MNVNCAEEEPHLHEAYVRSLYGSYEERLRAAAAVEEARAKRLRPLRGQNRLALSLRGVVDGVLLWPRIAVAVGVTFVGLAVSFNNVRAILLLQQTPGPRRDLAEHHDPVEGLRMSGSYCPP